MSIADKLTYLAGTKTAIKDAIVAKGVSVGESDTFRSYAAKVAAIETGPGTGDHLVRFIDFNGDILKEQYVNNGQNATAPTPPTHQYLTFHSWNRAITNVTEDRDVGAIYDTTDGKSYLFVTVNAITGLQPTIYLNKSTAAEMTINWGHGDNSVTSSTGNITIQKPSEYTAGSYIITITCSGAYTFGQGAAATAVFSNGSYAAILTAIYFGANITSVLGSSLQNCISVRRISIASAITTIGGGAFSTMRQIECIIVPHGVTSLGGSLAQNCFFLKFFVIPITVTVYTNYLIYINYNVKKLIIPGSMNTTSQMFNQMYSLEDLQIQGAYTVISAGMCSSCRALRSFDAPSTITTVQSTAFADCPNSKEYIFRSTTPPTLANINAFTGINPLCKIYVPDANLTDYKEATNWAAYAAYIYPLSTRP